MDIEQVVQSKMAEIVSSGFMDKIIEDQLKKTIKDVVDDALRSYSDFGKSLKEALAKALEVDFGHIDLPSYNQLVANWVKKIVNAAIITQGKAQIQENLKDFFKPLEKDTWRVTEIVEEFIKSIQEDDDRRERDGENITFIAEASGSFSHFYLDADGNKEKYRCKHRFGIHDGKIFNVNIDGVDAGTARFDRFYDFEGFLFKLYAAKATIIDDSGDVETYIGYDD